MKEERYNKLVELVGKEKADNIKNKMANEDEIKEAKEKMIIDRDKKFLELAIDKDDLEHCEYYNGIRFRGHGIAQWDKTKGKFLILSYNFNQPYVEELEHFFDVVNVSSDGFVPIEKIDRYKFFSIKNKQLTNEEIDKEIENLKK